MYPLGFGMRGAPDDDRVAVFSLSPLDLLFWSFQHAWIGSWLNNIRVAIYANHLFDPIVSDTSKRCKID
jgi:hypothetical protein